MFATLAWISLGSAFACALVITVDEIRHPQKMWIMNIVWPATALYLSVFALWAYFRKGRSMARDAMPTTAGDQKHHHRNQQEQQAWHSPTLVQTALAGSHCGAGCTLADIVTESAVFAAGATILGTELYASYVWDFVVAWLLGVAFQYFTIKPMRDLSAGAALWAAVKADTLSILTFQVGMYAWMALVYFKLFPGPHLHPNQPGYWLMMQIAMVFGYVTALPINWFLIRIGWKEVMG